MNEHPQDVAASSSRPLEQHDRRYPGGDSLKAVGYGDTPMQRTLRDYILILRERLWYVLVAFLVVFLAAVVLTLSATKQYTAAASVEILRHDPVVMKVQEVRDSGLQGPEDLNTQVKLLESGAIVSKVVERLSADDRRILMEPYEHSTEPITPEEVVMLSRKVVPVRQTRIIQVTFTHSNADMAAKIANLLVEEFMNYNTRWRVDESLKAVEDLKVRADQQRKKVQELANNLQAYKESHKMVSLDQRKDIVTEKLKALNTVLTQASSKLNEAEVRWKQVKECKDASGNLLNLSFISSAPSIQPLIQQVTTQKMAVAELQQRYRALHPKLQQATQSLAQAESELTKAVDAAATGVKNEYESSLSGFEQAKVDLANQETETLKLSGLEVEYQALDNELNVNEQLLANILSRMRETSMNASIESQNARIVDQASRPRKYSSPNTMLNLALGLVGGIGFGLGLAFLVAFLDDRVKSSHDIEGKLGLPLIGILPRLEKMKSEEKAQVALSNADPLASEAFRTLHSNLRLASIDTKPQVMMVTSTTPSEGKSFVTSNLALTFALHGERTVIVDCDLRKPNVHRGFGIANSKGVIDYCTADADLDSLIVRNPRTNLDVLPAGGHATAPTRILNSKKFAAMLEELRKRYDRVFLDTPPIAPVSDAMIILPHVDGVLYTLLFNHVRIKGARFCVNRLIDSKVPSIGAVLNGLSLNLSEYYYAEYYDKTYKDYHLGNNEVSTQKV